MNPEQSAKELVLGDALSGSKFAMAAIGAGFLAIVFSFLTVIGIIVGIAMVLIAMKFVKGGTNKMIAFLLGAVMIASGIASTLWGGATTTGITSTELKAVGGVWSLFGFALYPVDKIQGFIWNKPEATDWFTFKGIGSPTTTEPLSGGAI